MLGLGGALLIAPQARAQSEVASDHFDGTDSWAIALAAKPNVEKISPSSAAGKELQDRPVSMRTAPDHDRQENQRAEIVAVQEKRRVSSAKSAKQ